MSFEGKNNNYLVSSSDDQQCSDNVNENEDIESIEDGLAALSKADVKHTTTAVDMPKEIFQESTIANREEIDDASFSSHKEVVENMHQIEEENKMLKSEVDVIKSQMIEKDKF